MGRCSNCPYYKTIGSLGDPKAPIVIVGESPGPQELREGRPFVPEAPTGKLLWKTIPGGEELVESGQVYVTNAMQCYPGSAEQKSKHPQRVERARQICQRRLLDEIQKSPRKLLISVGDVARRSLLPHVQGKITAIRGRPYESPLAEFGVFPIVHPAALLHGGGKYTQLREDLRYAIQYAKTGIRRIPIKSRYVVVHNDYEADLVASLARDQAYVAADTETTGLDEYYDTITAFGLAWDPHTVYIFPPHLLHHLEQAFTSQNTKWIWHNGKFDVAFFRRIGLSARVDEDTMLLDYAIDEQPGHDLETIANDLIGAEDYKDVVKQYVKGSGRKQYWGDIPFDVLCEYRLGPDVSFTLQVWQHLRAEVAEDPALDKLYTKLLIPASEELYHVKKAGMPVDQERVRENEIQYIGSLTIPKKSTISDVVAQTDKEDLDGEIPILIKELQEIAGHPFNPYSPKQVAHILYEEMNLKSVKNKKGSTDAFTLERLPQTPFIVKLRELRIIGKAYGTYVKPYKTGQKVYPDGRIHPTLKLHTTRTGRLASEDPNSQNIPRKPQIRGQIRAKPGHVLLEADYNQAELRLIGDLSHDVLLTKIYNSDQMSLHDETAIALFGPNFDDPQRMRAKAVNFGIPYGREAYSIAEEFYTTKTEAQEWIDGWFSKYVEAGKFINRCRTSVRKGEVITTIFGRKKRHYIIPSDPTALKHMMNEAANFPPQSIASDFTLYSAVQVGPRLRKMGIEIINLVHDSIISECEEDWVLIDEANHMIKEQMELTPKLFGRTRIPYLVDTKVVDRWGSKQQLVRPTLEAA